MKFYVTSQSNSGPFVIPSEGPWLNFFEKILELEHRIVPPEENPDVFIFMNTSPQIVKKITREKMKAKKYLFYGGQK